MRRSAVNQKLGRARLIAVVTAVAVAATAPVGTVRTAEASAAQPDRHALAVARAETAIQQHGADVRASAGDTYEVFRSIVDSDGATHVRYTRKHRGLRVLGGDFVVHSAPDGTYAGASVGLHSALKLGITATVGAADATKAARAHFTGAITSAETPELVVDASSGVGRLAWETVVNGRGPDGQTPSRLHVITDAATGAKLHAFDDIASATGTGVGIASGTVSIDTTTTLALAFEMTDPLRGGGYVCDNHNNFAQLCSHFFDADNVWGNGTNGDRVSAAVDAHYGSAKAFDYLKNVHGRNGVFGDGRGVPAKVHVGDDWFNANWDSLTETMNFGDGIGNANPVISTDIVGHEMAHGLTTKLVPGGGLNRGGESGALDEATSDIIGTMVEFYAANPNDPPDYLIMEEVNFGGPFGGRYMYNPALDGKSDSCWSTTLHSNPHQAAGVANHFFYNLAEGTGAGPFGTSPICGSGPSVQGIGRAKAANIWYRALDVYFGSTTLYVDPAQPSDTARAYTLRAVADLHGLCSVEYRAVQRAWSAVNVAGSDALCSQPTLANPGTVPAVKGGNFTLAANASGHYGPLTYFAVGQPPGIQFNTATGVFSGAPAVGGFYSVTLRVTDAYGQTATVTFGMAVDVIVPDLRGLTSGGAKTVLEAHQLKLGLVGGQADPSCEKIGKVVSHVPVRGARVPANTVVNVKLGSMPTTPCP